MNMSNEWNIAQPEKKYASTNENVPNKINVAGKVHFGAPYTISCHTEIVIQHRCPGADACSHILSYSCILIICSCHRLAL